MANIKDQVMTALSTVIEPELYKNTVSMNRVREMWTSDE
jgi:metal-sulfur cluster biosynthetic enzyme